MYALEREFFLAQSIGGDHSGSGIGPRPGLRNQTGSDPAQRHHPLAKHERPDLDYVCDTFGDEYGIGKDGVFAGPTSALSAHEKEELAK